MINTFPQEIETFYLHSKTIKINLQIKTVNLVIYKWKLQSNTIRLTSLIIREKILVQVKSQ
jgi:hypothetical protein